MPSVYHILISSSVNLEGRTRRMTKKKMKERKGTSVCRCWLTSMRNQILKNKGSNLFDLNFLRVTSYVGFFFFFRPCTDLHSDSNTSHLMAVFRFTYVACYSKELTHEEHQEQRHTDSIPSSGSKTEPCSPEAVQTFF